MKKLLLLGGSRYLLPVIDAAHKLGVYVITCDYLPDNLAHEFSDEYHNVSIVDKEAVLELAQKLKVDGIMSYATDPGVAVAAYVAEKMGLPGCPYESVTILQNKGRFRKFLKDNGFNVPVAKTYKSDEEVSQDISILKFPCIVKPVDSAGSKGVTRVDKAEELTVAIERALAYSLSGEFIIEEFIEKNGFSTDSDSFSIDGKLVFFSLNDQWFDESSANPYTPAAYLWPSTMPEKTQQELELEIQRLLDLLKMGTSIYNIETRLGKDGKAYIMEVSPRAGGNRLSELLRMACGQDLITASVQGALGMDILQLERPVYNGFFGEAILHSNSEGIFKEVEISPELANYIEELDIWVKHGEYVHKFTGANETIGTVIVKCETQEKLTDVLQNIEKMISIVVE